MTAAVAEKTDAEIREFLLALAEKISALSQRADWPADKYARVVASEFQSEISDYWSDDDCEILDEWADNATAADDISSNNVELWLDCPCDLTDWLEEALMENCEGGKPTGEPTESQSCNSTGDNLPPKPETPDEARKRIEGMIPTALQMLRDATEIAESRKKAHEAAKKNVEAQQSQLNDLVSELSEALTGVAGGDYQYRLPFDRIDAQAESVPVGLVAADPIAGEAVSILVADQLSGKTNGKSDGAGIPQGTVDLLVDASLGTIGLLEEHMRKRGEFWAKDIKGIGPGKAEKIIAALGVLRACFPIPSVG